MTRKYPMDDIHAADPIARELSRMFKEEDIAVFGPRILKLMAGVPWTVFKVLDEQPGRWGYMNDRFYMLRRVRNDQFYGHKLFEGLRR
jgi:hypothetical protein